MDDDETRFTTYICTTGHEIARADFDALTEVLCLDGTANVRVCREHGTAVAVHTAPQKS